MKTYKKRIAFCLSDQHSIPHGGLGQFAKSFEKLRERAPKIENALVSMLKDKKVQ
jgi:hypothetical protein